MDPFPKAYELISFFEGEPSVLDPGIPWAYNALRFETVVGEDRIACDLEPGMCAFMIRWNRGGVEVLNLDLHGISGLVIDTWKGGETFVASFQNPQLDDLRLTLRPTPRVVWGMNARL